MIFSDPLSLKDLDTHLTHFYFDILFLPYAFICIAMSELDPNDRVPVQVSLLWFSLFFPRKRTSDKI